MMWVDTVRNSTRRATDKIKRRGEEQIAIYSRAIKRRRAKQVEIHTVLAEVAPGKLKKDKVGAIKRIAWEIGRQRFWIGTGVALAGIAARGRGGQVLEEAGARISGIDKNKREKAKKVIGSTNIYELIIMAIIKIADLVISLFRKEKKDEVI